MASEWTTEEIQYLKANWEKESDSEIASELGRTKDAVTHKRSQYRLVNLSYHWSEKEIEILKKNYNETVKTLSNLIDRSPKAIKAKKRSISRQTNCCVDCGKEDPEFYVDSAGHRWNMCRECVKDIIPEFV